MCIRDRTTLRYQKKVYCMACLDTVNYIALYDKAFYTVITVRYHMRRITGHHYMAYYMTYYAKAYYTIITARYHKKPITRLAIIKCIT